MKNKLLATFWTMLFTLIIVGIILMLVYELYIWGLITVIGFLVCLLWILIYELIKEDKK